MQNPHLDPLSAPAEWHRYLYRSILLPWETSLKHQESFPRYVRGKAIARVQLHKWSAIHDVERAWNSGSVGSDKSSSLTFFSNRAAYKDLIALLRNCVAHGHYTPVGRFKVHFWHKYDGKLKLFGTLRFSELKDLVALLHPT